MGKIITLSDESIRKLAEQMRAQQFRPINTPRTFPADVSDLQSKQVRIARTTTSTEHPSYPDAPANCYVVELGEMVPDGTVEPGEVAFNFTSYDPAKKRLAFVRDGYLPENSIVYIRLCHGRWWIIEPAPSYGFSRAITYTGGASTPSPISIGSNTPQPVPDSQDTTDHSWGLANGWHPETKTEGLWKERWVCDVPGTWRIHFRATVSTRKEMNLQVTPRYHRVDSEGNPTTTGILGSGWVYCPDQSAAYDDRGAWVEVSHERTFWFKEGYFFTVAYFQDILPDPLPLVRSAQWTFQWLGPHPDQ